jgi:hypothetical protein
MTFTPEDHPRAATGEFTAKGHSAPEAALTAEKPPLDEQIAAYLNDYTDAQEAYAEADGDDDAYEDWEDFQTDNSGHAASLLADAQAEIAHLRADLEAASSKHTIPEVLREHIENTHPNGSEAALYVFESGHSDDYYDVMAYVDGETPHKYTLDPDGEITSFVARA